jgi:hypothetical protein
MRLGIKLACRMEILVEKIYPKQNSVIGRGRLVYVSPNWSAQN